MRREPSEADTTPWCICGAAAALCLVLIAMAFVKVHDFDLFWHLATARRALEEGRLPTSDPFSYTSGGQLRYSEILAQLYFYGGFFLDGARGIQFSTALLILTCGALVFLLARTSTQLRTGFQESGPSNKEAQLALVAALLATGIWAGASFYRFGPKADLFSLLGLCGALLLMTRLGPRPGARALGLLFALAALWGNLHRGATLVLPLLCAWTAVAAFRGQRDRMRFGLLALLVATAALCLNLGNFYTLSSSFQLPRRTSFRALFPEWGPMTLDFLELNPWFLAVVALWSWGLLRHQRLEAADLFAAFLLLMSIHTVRFSPFFAAAALPSLTFGTLGILQGLMAGEAKRIRRWCGWAAWGAPAVASAALLLGTPRGYWGVGWAELSLPIEGANYLQRHPPPGRMWNSFNLGGYLLFRLGPELSVFIDGRNDTVYSDLLLREAALSSVSQEHFQRVVERYGIDYAVVECSSIQCKRLPFLADQDDWVPVFLGDACAIFVKRSSKTENYLQEHAFTVLHPHRVASQLERFPTTTEAPLLERDVLVAVRKAPRSLRARYLLSLVHKKRGRPHQYREQRSVFLELARAKGSSLTPPSWDLQ